MEKNYMNIFFELNFIFEFVYLSIKKEKKIELYNSVPFLDRCKR